MGFAQDYIKNMHDILNNIDCGKIEEIGDLFYSTWDKGRQIFILGNGGSAATASHFACDLGKGTLKNEYDKKEKRIKVISLTDNVSTITAYSNDVGYEEVFSQQLRNLVNPADLVTIITGSGNSKNIIRAVEAAKEMQAATIGLLGFNGGKVKDMLSKYILVPSNHYGRIEDAHLMLCHLISGYIFNKKHPI